MTAYYTVQASRLRFALKEKNRLIKRGAGVGRWPVSIIRRETTAGWRIPGVVLARPLIGLTALLQNLQAAGLSTTGAPL